MRSRMRKYGPIAVLGVAAVTLAGCAGGGSGGGGNGGDGGGSDSLPSTGWVAADRDAVEDGGSLTLALDDTIANWNPSNADAGTVDSDDVSDLFLPRWINIAEDGSWEPNPDYVTSIELTSEEPQVVEVSLNPDAVWSDGTPMTFADFQGMFTAQNGLTPEYAPNSTNVFKDMASVEQGETDRDIVITYNTPNADWVSVFDNIVPSWLTVDPTTYNTLWQALPVAQDGTTIVSGGPFIVDSFDSNGGVITYVRNPSWWGETPKLDEVVYRVVDRASVGQSFANGELDVAEINASVDTLNATQGRSDAEILAARGVTYSHITLNGTTGVFQDQAVRQAFAQSLNREVITQAAVQPLGVEPEVLNNLIFQPGQDGYTDDSEPIAFDVEAAQATLEEAGWTGDGVREKDGERLTVRLVIPSENPNSATIAQQIQPMAAEAGFDVTIDTVPSADFFTEYINVENRDFEATLFAWQGTPFPISSTESIFYPADSGQNYPGVTDDSLGDLWLQANSELDPDDRLGIAQQIDEIIMAQAQTIPLFARPNQHAVADGVVNFGPAQFQSTDWTLVGWAAE